MQRTSSNEYFKTLQIGICKYVKSNNIISYDVDSCNELSCIWCIVKQSFILPVLCDVQDTFLHLPSLHRTLPSTSCCMPEISRATNRWWRGKSMAASRPTDLKHEKHSGRERKGRRKERVRPRTICPCQTEGRLSLRGFHAWMVWEQTATLTTVCCTLNPADYTGDVLRLH